MVLLMRIKLNRDEDMNSFFPGKSVFIFLVLCGEYKTRISSTTKNRNWLIFLVRNSYVNEMCKK